jgi:hypothetical protein
MATTARSQGVAKSTSIVAANPPKARNDLRQALFELLHAEEVYFQAHDTYSAHADTILAQAHAKIAETVTIKIVFAGSRGWEATATDARWVEGSCAIFLGDLGLAEFAQTKKGQKLTAKADGQPVCDWI